MGHSSLDFFTTKSVRLEATSSWLTFFVSSLYDGKLNVRSQI